MNNIITSPITANSTAVNVTSASAEFATMMARDEFYVFTSSVDCWIHQASPTSTASAAPGSAFIPANVPVYINGGVGAKLAVVRDSGDGTATLTRVLA